MTPEERALQALRNCRNWLVYREALPSITEAIKEAIRDEREKCAQVADDLARGEYVHDQACWAAARLIRQRGTAGKATQAPDQGR